MISRLLYRLVLFASKQPKWVVLWALGLILILPFFGIISAKIYQGLDNDDDRGGVAITDGVFNEKFATPEYLNQGWSANDSLWFYTTTQGSAFLPYDFILALEQPSFDAAKPALTKKIDCERGGEKGPWFLCDEKVDYFRYLPQKVTFFNPGALPVGFAKETYQGKDYVGLTCAACHTSQVNFEGRAMRIDGGPAMADMVTFLTEMTRALDQTKRKTNQENPRLDRFIKRVMDLGNDYSDPAEIEKDLKKWFDTRELYNTVNRSTYKKDTDEVSFRNLDYGYARLDAFGRIYNRVLQHAINTKQIVQKLSAVTRKGEPTERLLLQEQITLVLADVQKSGRTVLGDKEFTSILDNLMSDKPGYPNLNLRQMLRIRDAIFNIANAPVSYPFLWDITRTDYVQWNGIANNAGLGPLGRNTGEVIGVFSILDWHEDKGMWAALSKFSPAAALSGQGKKKKIINFKSSVDSFNLGRLENHLDSLMSPVWPFCKNASSGAYYLPTGPKEVAVDERLCNGEDKKLDKEMVSKGQQIYAKKCQDCHDVVDREAWDRLVTAKFQSIKSPQTTDEQMALNSVTYQGKSGNFNNTYQKVDAGTLVIREDAPVAQILTSATKGVVATPDADKWFPRRIVEWVYTLVTSFLDTPIENSMKAGTYMPDTTAEPYNSLQAYRARSLNGIWATAPYLHNGSVPTLYDLLLPENPGIGCEKTRPKSFLVGAREFDPKNVGFKSEGYNGFRFDTSLPGNKNKGHEYGICGMTDEQRWQLIEYLKSL